MSLIDTTRFLFDASDDGGSGEAPPVTGTPAGSTPSIEGFSSEAQDYIKRLRGENASRRTENKALAERLDAIETAGKTEEEKRQTALASTQSENSTLASRLSKYEVAAAKGLPLSVADRLQGSTKEELETDADALKGLLGANPGDGGGFDGGVRRPVTQPKTMNGMIAAAAGRG